MTDHDKAKKMMHRMRQDMTRLIKKYHAEATELSTNHQDPHTPVLGCLQIAICNAAAKYLMENGVDGATAFHTILNTLNDGQHHWSRAITAGQVKQGKPYAN